MGIETPDQLSTVLRDHAPDHSFWRAKLTPFVARDYFLTVAIVALCLVLCWISQELSLADVNGVMIYLAGVGFIAARFGHGPVILGSILSVFSFQCFFVPPVFGFKPSDTEYFITLIVMLGIGLSISELTARLKSQLRTAQQQEQRTAQLYQMTLQLNEHVGLDSLLSTAGRCVADIFGSEVALYMIGNDHSLSLCFGRDATFVNEPNHLLCVHWVAKHNQPAGVGTDSFNDLSANYVPMIGSQRTVGVLASRQLAAGNPLDAEHRRMLATCANLIALSVERDQSREEAQQAQVQVQTEQLRNSLLSAVSHDLRTPLAMIAVTASSLLQDDAAADPALHRENLELVVDESDRLARQVDNLLEMAQLNSGTLTIQRDWHVFEELVGVALHRMRRELNDDTLIVNIPEDFPLLWVADDLIEQMLINLLDNAVRYTPAGSRIEIFARQCGERVEIRVADDGPGLPPGSEELIFDRFFRAANIVADGQRGIGLGLAICRSIAALHGGEIAAANRSGGGAEFVISLPCPPNSPSLEVNEGSASAV